MCAGIFVLGLNGYTALKDPVYLNPRTFWNGSYSSGLSTMNDTLGPFALVPAVFSVSKRSNERLSDVISCRNRLVPTAPRNGLAALWQQLADVEADHSLWDRQ